MKALAREGLLLATVALLGGCAGLQSSTGAPGSFSQSGNAMGLMPHHVQRLVNVDHGRSWMLPQKEGARSTLIYAADDQTYDVSVYDYSDGKFVGTLTGFDVPYGGCVDAKGDVYITNYGAGTVVEYAHGGTKVINTYDSGGTPIGCSVDSKGDVAVSSFDPGAVVFAGGSPKKGVTYSGGACTYLWSMGYDHSGNLIGVGETSSGGRCYAGLLAGATSMSSLSFSGTIDFPGGTMWDGKYIALGDQEAGGTFNTGIYPSTLKGSTLSPVGSEVIFTDTCYNNYSDIEHAFIVGKKNTPVDDRQGKVVVGTNGWCADGGGGGGGGIKFWHYPQGGNPFKAYSHDSGTVLAVSIGT
jgi:hypothetical protein